MIRTWINYTIMFISLVLIQVLLLNYIQFSGFINPYIYVLFVLLLPVSTPRYAVVLLGFFMGLVIDIFSNTLGMHAAATTFMAFARPVVMNVISAREMDKSDYPGLQQYGFLWFLYYAGILVFMHHVIFFYIEAFTFTNFIHTFIRCFLSSLFSIFMIVLSQFLVFRH
jgi:rod shape-determining protein MreD